MRGRSTALLCPALALAASVQAGAALADAGAGDAGAESGAPQLDAAAADGAWEDAGEGCGDLTYQGECVGSMVRYCDVNGVVRTIACADYAGACGLVDCERSDCYGFSCVAGEGESCRELFCDVRLEHGCLGGVCVRSEACDRVAYAARCEGALLVFCPTGRVWDEDCSDQGSYPATCGPTSAGELGCLRTAGGQCDPVQGIECAPDLVCQDGFCSATAVVDAGAGDTADAGDGAAGGGRGDRPAGGCGCDGAGGTPGSALAVTALAPWWARRGRRRRHRRWALF